MMGSTEDWKTTNHDSATTCSIQIGDYYSQATLYHRENDIAYYVAINTRDQMTLIYRKLHFKGTLDCARKNCERLIEQTMLENKFEW